MQLYKLSSHQQENTQSNESVLSTINLVPANDNQCINLLIVDDDDVAVESFIRTVDKLGVRFPITVAEDGQVALDILHKKNKNNAAGTPNIILLDLRMPRMDGFEFLNALRKDPTLCDLEVYVLTTSDSAQDKEKAQQQNVAGYLVKDSNEIMAWLYDLLPQHTSYEQFANRIKNPNNNLKVV
jgi:CheY-like chemotaxis protein